MRRFSLQIWSVVIAVALWWQVHGQGEGSLLSIDVPLQVQGLPADMVVVNNLPDRVRLTVSGLKARMKELHQEELIVPLDVSDIDSPGVVERALQAELVQLPTGLRIEKIQPDRVQLQVDRVVTRLVPVAARLELPEGWLAKGVSVEPDQVSLIGPEVWLDALKQVETTPIRPADPKNGPFEVKVGVESPTGKAIRLEDAKVQITVRGLLIRKREAEQADGGN